MNTFILCAGQASRWDGPGLKHLVPTHGEPLLHRTLRMLREVGRSPIIVTHRHDLMVPGVLTLRPECHEFTAQTVMSTRRHWHPLNNVFLLGDVVWTEAALHSVLHSTMCRDDVTFYTDTQDIFGMSYGGQPARLRLEGACAEVLKAAPVHNHGRLWEVYRKLHGLPNHAGVPLPEHYGGQLQLVDDETQDIDSEAEYRDWLHGVSKNKLCRQRAEGSPSSPATRT